MVIREHEEGKFDEATGVERWQLCKLGDKRVVKRMLAQGRKMMPKTLARVRRLRSFAGWSNIMALGFGLLAAAIVKCGMNKAT